MHQEASGSLTGVFGGGPEASRRHLEAFVVHLGLAAVRPRRPKSAHRTVVIREFGSVRTWAVCQRHKAQIWHVNCRFCMQIDVCALLFGRRETRVQNRCYVRLAAKW